MCSSCKNDGILRELNFVNSYVHVYWKEQMEVVFGECRTGLARGQSSQDRGPNL